MSNYIKIDPARLRREYGMNVQRKRISIQPDILDALEEIGVVKRKLGAIDPQTLKPAKVLEAGGYGSPFLQVSALLMLGLLHTDPENQHLFEVAERMRQALTFLDLADGDVELTKNTERLDTFIHNLSEFQHLLMRQEPEEAPEEESE